MQPDIKQQCWDMWVGHDELTHRCFCCEKWIVRKSLFQYTYFTSKVNGGKHEAENLRPVCKECNKVIDSENLENYKRKNGFIQAGTKKPTFTKAYIKWSKSRLEIKALDSKM